MGPSRRATASKVVIGREEIDKFGGATVGEELRRLPGVTTPGAPGRGWPLTHTINAGIFTPRSDSTSASHTTVEDEATGQLVEDRRGQSHTLEKRFGTSAFVPMRLWQINLL